MISPEEVILIVILLLPIFTMFYYLYDSIRSHKKYTINDLLNRPYTVIDDSKFEDYIDYKLMLLAIDLGYEKVNENEYRFKSKDLKGKKNDKSTR